MIIDSLRMYTFPGGTHPPECKELTKERRIIPGPLVEQVTIMLNQHIGAPCNALVKKGDIVRAGQKIGDNEAFVCAPVHSPVNGTVKEISLQPHAVLGRGMGIVIEVDKETYRPKQPVFSRFDKTFDPALYEPQRIREVARQAGLVGMGGAGFPTRVKLEPNPKVTKEAILINGCECEPYITDDYRLMMEWTWQVLAGVKLAARASECNKVYIAIEDNKPKALAVMQEAVQSAPGCDGIQVVPVKTKYPQGGERQLIRSVLARYVPTGGIPPMIGVLVLNVATVAALAEAVVCDQPLTHRVVTVSGQAVAEPGNLYVPLGITVRELIEFCGGVTEKSTRVVLGGPMMGLALADLDTPITKTSGAITVLTGRQMGLAKFRHQQTPCIRCGRCLAACPEGLNPTRIAHAVRKNAWDAAKDHYITACIECGCCSYVCPAKIELTGYIRTGKIFLARQQKKMPQ